MNIHLVAICGTGMGSLAGLLKEEGHRVQGSDHAFYPPMSERLQAWGIPTMKGFDPGHLAADLDLVVVGNACRKDNPEAVAAGERGLRVMSFPQALSELFIADRRSIVVAGTHGKTTTSALVAYLLTEADRDPSFLVGGIPLDFGKSYRLGDGPDFVIEGDEYDSAFFDKRPKFLHYRPRFAALTSIEFDHADIYADMQAYRGAFSSFIELLPANGELFAFDGDPDVTTVVRAAGCRVTAYGLGTGWGWRAMDVEEGPGGTSFLLVTNGEERGRVHLPLAGRHNVANCLAAMALSEAAGVPAEQAAELLTGYAGVARRMQVRGVAAGVTIIDDFAHHPTAVKETVRAVRRRYPRAQLVAVFEPRTNTSRRRFFQERYPGAFRDADRAVIVPPYHPEQIPADERFDSGQLVSQLVTRGQDAVLAGNADEVVELLAGDLDPGAVVLIMSNGAFDDIHEKLLAALGKRRRERP